MGQGLDIGAMQRVQEKKLPYPLPPVSLIDGEAPEKRGRHQRLRWKSNLPYTVSGSVYRRKS
jgi:hypothetical protein